MNIIDIAVKRPVTIWMFTLAVLLFGMVSLSRLAINLLPELSYPTLTIRTDYVGAAPSEIEQLVSKPIEETIGVVKGVHTVTSTSKAGQSDVLLEFNWGTDMDLASLEVREKLDTLQLPLDVTKPLLLRFNPSLDPIMRLGLASTDTSSQGQNSLNEKGIKALRLYGEEQIKRQLESVAGVASVKVSGGLENEIQVLVDQQKTNQLNLNVTDIITRLKQENVNTSGGRVKDGSQEYLVRTLNQFKSLDDIRNIFIATKDNKNIRLGDIAIVKEAFKDPSSMNRFNGSEGVEIAIYKEGDANTVQVAENIQYSIKQIQNDLPTKYQMQLLYDQSTFIASAINEVKSAGIIGGLLAMAVLYLFLKNIWSTVIISISIPVSIIATFNLMYSNDISLNIMSLGGIALAIGLLVDNSIVVLENIARHKSLNKEPKVAAALGTKEVSTAIIASTLTTMAVFFPLVFVEGVAGQLFSDQALTVTFALGASLLVALTLIPMLAARERGKQTKSGKEKITFAAPLPKSKPINKGALALYYIALPFHLFFRAIGLIIYYLLLGVSTLVIGLFRILAKASKFALQPTIWFFETVFHYTELAYLAALKLALRMRVAVVLVILVISGLSIVLLPKVGMELIPDMSQGEFYVEVNLPTGSQLQQTDNIIADLAIFTAKLPGVERTYSLAGTGSLMNATANQGGDNWGKLNVVMVPSSIQSVTSDVMAEMRTYLAKQPGIQSKFGKPSLFTFATPLAVQLVGYDLVELSKYSQALKDSLQSDDRFADVESSLQAGSPQLKVQFDHSRMAQLGINAPSVSKLIAAKVGGEVATQYSVQDRKVDILVRTIEKQRDSIQDIGQIIVNPGATPAVPLHAIADISMSIGPSEITRISQERVALVSANLNYGDLNEAVAEVNTHIKQLKLPLKIKAKVAGQSEEMKTSFQSLQFALALAIFLVYLVMASQFESLLHPLLILFTVPLACAGSIYGLYLSGTNISVVVFIGLIMLAGIVVNNAIVLIDRINQLRASGIDKTQAIIDSAQSRLRPILMTTLTTTLGLLPMAIGMGEGAEIRTPMAITVIYGLLFATLLTLIFIPVLYSLFDRKAFNTASTKPANETKKGDPVYG
ncbi:efflux RND transporter permease subunit [Paraglaciecola sp. 2405UD69-4]|uniref:efflux RND transporter permease subunit n=1 Tax=Paraglaciecola sp. 2405UD69-4 TaxID=3391836 RepID=UPI0039C8F5EF